MNITKTKSYIISLFLLIFYSIGIILLPNFHFYVEVRAILFPVIISALVTIINFDNVKSISGFIFRLLIYILFGYISRAMFYYILNGEFDVSVRHLLNDWYILYIILQVPIIIISSVVTFFFMKIVKKRKG